MGGTPLPPFTDFPPKICLQKGLKMVFFVFCYGFGEFPPPPRYGFFFSEKGVTDLGGTPAPPFTDNIRKVVFEVFPKNHVVLVILAI